MAEDRLDSYADIPALQKETDETLKFLNQIKAAIKELDGMKVSIFNTSTASGAASDTKAMTNGIKEVTEATKGYVTMSKELRRERQLEIAGTKEALAVQKMAAQQAKEDKKIADELSNSYKQLQLYVKANLDRYNQLAASLGVNHKLTQEALNDYKLLNNQLITINRSAGNWRDNVGNYKSAFDGLGMSMQQILREAPAFANSVQTGFLAISNNLPVFFDQIAQARNEIKALQADGKEAPSLLSRLGAGFFTINTALTIGVTLLTVYGAKIVDALFGQTQAMKDAEAAQKKYTEALNSAESSEKKNAIEKISRLNILTSLAQDNAQSERTRLKAVKELQDTYPSLFGNMSKQTIMEGDLKDAINETTQALLSRAAAQAAEKKFVLASEQLYDLNEKRIKQQVEYNQKVERVNKAEQELLKTGSDAANREYILANRARDKARAQLDEIENAFLKAGYEQRRYLEDAKRLGKEAGDIVVNDGSNRRTTTPRAAAPTDNSMSNLEGFQKYIFDKAEAKSKDAMEKIMSGLNDIALEQTKIQDEQLTQLLSQLEQGLISVDEYNAKKTQITATTEDTILKLQLDSIRKYLEAEGLLYPEIQKIEEKITEMTKDELEKRNKAREDAAKRSAKNLEGFQAEMYRRKEAADKRQDELEVQRDERIKRQAQQLYRDLVNLFYAQSEAKISQLQKEQEKREEDYSKERDAIEASSLSQKEKTEKIKVLNEEEAASRKNTEKEIAKERRKQAEFAKAQALADIAIKTAQAIMASVAASPLTGGLPWSAIAGALGAAQAAIVLATPIPAYAKGKKKSDSYTGKALAGEAGAELKIDPSGKMTLIDKPTIIDTKAGDRILSNTELMALADNRKQAASVDRTNELIQAYAGIAKLGIKSADKNADKIVSAIYSLQTNDAYNQSSRWASA